MITDDWITGIFIISGQFKLGYPLSIPCSKIFDSCKIKRMVTYLTQLGYVNNYDKNRYLEKISKAAVQLEMNFTVNDSCYTNLGSGWEAIKR